VIQTFLSFLDRLIPPTFERITASIERAHNRLASFAGAKYREANRQRDISDAALGLATAAVAEAERASRVKTKLRDLLQ
jgi:hypothetical protein